MDSQEKEMKKIVSLLAVVFLSLHVVLAQGTEGDTLVINRTFLDINGCNEFVVRVVNPYGENNYGGSENSVTVRLCNENYSDTLIYDNPGYEMSAIRLSEDNIVFRSVDGRRAVFIPFSCGGNADDDMQIACIVLYDHKKQLYHIRLRGEEFQHYKIIDDLNEVFKGLDSRLRMELKGFIESEYEAIIGTE